MKLKIKDVKSNPFKKYINNGKLVEERLDVMKESIEHGTLPERFTVRKNKNDFELCFGHHRIKALEKIKGKDYEIKVDIVNYSDELMLKDMVRENLSHRDTDFHDTRDSVKLAYLWLTSGEQSVKRFDTLSKNKNWLKGKKGFQELPDSCRSIRDFLSKNGKTISHQTIQNYLNIDKLDKKIIEKVGKFSSGYEKEKEQGISVSVASALSQLPKQEQFQVYKNLQNESITRNESLKAIRKFKEEDKETKRLIKEGKIGIKTLINNSKEIQPIQKKEVQTVDEEISQLNDIMLLYSKKIEYFSKEILPNCSKGQKNFLKLHIKGALEQLKIFYDKLTLVKK